MEQRRNIGLLRVDKNRNTNSCFLGLCFLNKLKNICYHAQYNNLWKWYQCHYCMCNKKIRQYNTITTEQQKWLGKVRRRLKKVFQLMTGNEDDPAFSKRESGSVYWGVSAYREHSRAAKYLEESEQRSKASAQVWTTGSWQRHRQMWVTQEKCFPQASGYFTVVNINRTSDNHK